MATPSDYARARGEAEASSDDGDGGDGDSGGSTDGGDSGSDGGGGGGFTPSDYARARGQAEADSGGNGGGEESPPGEGDEVTPAGEPGQDDPDNGDDTTRRIREGAESDPMSEQTEPDQPQTGRDAYAQFAEREGTDGVSDPDEEFTPSSYARSRAQADAEGDAPRAPESGPMDAGQADARDLPSEAGIAGVPGQQERITEAGERARESQFTERGAAGVPGQQDRITAAGQTTTREYTQVRGRAEQAVSDIEQDISEQAGAELDFGEDFRITETGEVELTEAGERVVRGDEFERDFIDVGGLPGVEEGTTLEDALRGAQSTVQEASARTAENLSFARSTGPLASGTLIGQTAAPVPGMTEEGDVDPESQGQFENVFRGVGDLVAAPASIGVASIELAEFGVEAADVARTEGIGIEATDTPARPVRTGPGPPVERPGREVSISEEGVVPFVAEETAETGEQIVEGLEQEVRSPTGRARLAGSLVGSALIMGGAAAISSRAGLATRAAIQPGEEILGYGGFGVTRRVAGRGAAQRLFPNQEPLIFSEEAAIRGARRLGGAARRGTGRARTRMADFALGEAETTVETTPSSFEGFQNVGAVETERPGVRSRIGDLRARIGEDIRGTDRGQLQLPAGRTRAETETEDPRTITEEEILPPRAEPDQGPFFDPTTRELRREAGEAPSNVAREVGRPAVEVEQEAGRRTRRRAESAIAVDSLAFEGLGMDTFALGETRTRADTIGRADTITDTTIDTESRAGSELAQELGVEVRTGAEARTGIETDLETEFETGLEVEFETRREIEGEFLAEDDQEESDLFGTRGPGWTRRLERDLINPITGE